MKDIPMKRIFRYFLAVMIVLFFVANVLSNEARATTTTGNITLEEEYIKVYDTTPDFAAATYSWDTFYFYTASYTNVHEVIVTSESGISDITFDDDYDSTTFSCLTNCSGTGTVWYDTNSTRIYWLFDNVEVTGSPAVISYATNIFTKVHVEFSRYKSVQDVSQNKPLEFKAADVPAGKPNGAIALNYSLVDVSIQNTDTYTYVKNDTYWTLSINKGTKIDSKYFLFNQSNIELTHEATFNKVDFNFTSTDDDGLYTNTTTAAGAYTLTNIDITGLPETPNEPGDNVLNGVGLTWGFDNYALGAIGNISWSKSTPSGACDVIRIYNPDGIETDFLENPSDTGFYKTLLDKTGTWKVEYRRQSICFISSEAVLNTDYTSVNPENPSYITINGTVPIGQLVNTTYRIGWIPAGNVFIKTYRADDQINAENVYSVSTAQNTDITTQILFTSAGLHYVRLCDPVLGCKAQTLTTAFFNGSEVTTNISQSNITMDKSAYSYGDHATVLTAVDNFNWSNKQISVVSYNWNYSIEQHQQYVLDQVFSFDQFISDTTFAASGDYSMRLVGTNFTGTYILSFWNFTLADVDAEGYGLSLSNNTICTGDLVNIKVTVPSISFLNISFDDVRYNKDYIVNQSKIIPYRFIKSGTYYITLHDTSMEAKRNLVVTTSSCIAPTPTPGANQGKQQATEMANLLMSNAFWSFIITAGLMIYIAWRTRNGMASVLIGALSLTVFTYMAWFPLWGYFSILIICAVLLSAKWVSQQFDIGTGGD